jgi:hypothetical protein
MGLRALGRDRFVWFTVSGATRSPPTGVGGLDGGAKARGNARTGESGRNSRAEQDCLK